MLLRLRRALVVSALGRNLAVNLVSKYGNGAPEVIRDELASGDPSADEREVFLKAQKITRKLVRLPR